MVGKLLVTELKLPSKKGLSYSFSHKFQKVTSYSYHLKSLSLAKFFEAKCKSELLSMQGETAKPPIENAV